MSLKLYQAQSTNYLIGTSQSDSLIQGHNRRGNFPTIQEVYIQSTSTSEWYSNIEIYTTSTSGDDYYSGAAGFGVKLYYGVLQPSYKVWDQIPFGNREYISNIGTNGDPDLSYKSLWIYSHTPTNAEEGLYNFNIVIKSAQHPV